MKDLGMENFSELAGSDNVDYNSFIRYCMDFAGAYGANRVNWPHRIHVFDPSQIVFASGTDLQSIMSISLETS